MAAIVLDIEGTTTPIAFVYNTLFPYARARVRGYLEVHRDSPECRSIVDRLRREHAVETGEASDVPGWDDGALDSSVDSAARYALWLMDRDRKSPALKELQGRIWKEGYASGELVGEVFDDVPGALQRWRAQKVGVGIYSSGSVLAQQLLFRHSSAGDLTPLLRWHFDTAVGPKVEAASYARIANAIGLAPSSILFVSDVVAELDAARAAGLRTILCLRPGNVAQPAAPGHPITRSLADVDGPTGHA